MPLKGAKKKGTTKCTTRQSEDSWQKEGGISRRFREEPCWQCSTKPWKLQEGLGEESRWQCCTEPWELLEGPWKKLCTKPRKLHEGLGEVAMTVLHGAVRDTWRTLRKVVHEVTKFTWRIWKRIVLTAVRSKANYSKDVKASWTLKRWRYVMLCVWSLNYLCALSRYLLKPPNNSEVENFIDKVFDKIFNKDIDRSTIMENFSEKFGNLVKRCPYVTDGDLLVALLPRKLWEIILL